MCTLLSRHHGIPRSRTSFIPPEFLFVINSAEFLGRGALFSLDTRIERMALPNLRRLFVEARTEAEENEYSRNAVREYVRLQYAANTDCCLVLQLGTFHFVGGCLQPSGPAHERQ